jgi:hypothetical protein
MSFQSIKLSREGKFTSRTHYNISHVHDYERTVSYTIREWAKTGATATIPSQPHYCHVLHSSFRTCSIYNATSLKDLEELEHIDLL